MLYTEGTALSSNEPSSSFKAIVQRTVFKETPSSEKKLI